jgi:uncharacterized protein (DUF302 family)
VPALTAEVPTHGVGRHAGGAHESDWQLCDGGHDPAKLGACNPPLAHRALEAEPHVGVLLPCNVVIWDDGDHRVVAAMEPRVMSGIIADPEIEAVADEVSSRLAQALERLG